MTTNAISTDATTDIPIMCRVRHLLVLFTVTTIVAMVTPGPDMLFILGCGVRGGPRVGRIGGWLRRRQAARRRVATGSVFIGLGVRLAGER